MAISAERIAELIRSPFRDNIPRWEDLPADPLRRVLFLRQRFPAEAVPAVLELSELRSRARSKFSRAERMFFDREALEQSTGEVPARWRARLFAGRHTVADLTGGAGGDAIALAGVSRVLASDTSPARCEMLRANAEVYCVEDQVTVRAAPAGEFPAAEAYFLDPSRRASGRRSRHLEGLSPSLRILPEIFRVTRDVAVKLSPATPDDELAELGGALEFVSEGGVCKEAVVWFGDLPPHRRWASILPEGHILAASPGVSKPPVSPPLDYLLEPDPAVVRAGLIPELCSQLGAAVLDARVGYLTAAAPAASPFVRSYRVLAGMPFSEKALRAELRNLGIGRVEVKKRASAVDADRLRTRLESDLPGHATVVVTRLGDRPAAFICCRSSAGPDGGH